MLRKGTLDNLSHMQTELSPFPVTRFLSRTQKRFCVTRLLLSWRPFVFFGEGSLPGFCCCVRKWDCLSFSSISWTHLWGSELDLIYVSISVKSCRFLPYSWNCIEKILLSGIWLYWKLTGDVIGHCFIIIWRVPGIPVLCYVGSYWYPQTVTPLYVVITSSQSFPFPLTCQRFRIHMQALCLGIS